MAATLPRAPALSETPVSGAPPDPSPRRPFRDNPGLILLVIALLGAALVAMVTFADRSATLSADFLSEVVLYALSFADLTMLAALVFVLARNIIKLVVERRRALPFARFRYKLVLMLLGMTIVPASLVLIVGSELIRNSANRWFSAPIDDVLRSAQDIASDYYQERQRAVGAEAARIAANLASTPLEGDVGVLRDAVSSEVTALRVGVVELYRVVPGEGGPRVVPIVDVAAPALPRGYARAGGDRLAAQIVQGTGDGRMIERLPDGGELVRVARAVRPPGGGPPVGVVVASEYLGGDLARNARRIVDAYESYQQLRVLKRPLEGVYLSFFLMVTLLILVGATWMGLYLAKRITRPVQRLAAAAREIGAGRFDQRIEPETRDEFGSLVEAFNTMAAELTVSQRRLERSRLDLERTNAAVEGRRRYIEAILERIATGVISMDAEGRVSTINGAAMRLLRLDAGVVGQPAGAVFAREDLAPLGPLIERTTRGGGRETGGQEVALAQEGREFYLAVAATTLQGETGGTEGFVVVLDDVTPLIRAQKVAAWRDVARRLAHEVKNPLTPIQLSAERLRRYFAQAPDPTRRLVDECSNTIVQEVESLKLLVDEFSQFARMPAPRTVPSDLHQLIRDALALYRGLFQHIRIEPRFTPTLPLVRVDQEQFRRVVINLVDNAIEAITGSGEAPGGGGLVTVETQHDAANGVARVVIGDNGPGISEADRQRLFMPYYSTKRRGSGLGLAIVRRIVVEHGGSIESADNVPRGTRMTIDLPC